MIKETMTREQRIMTAINMDVPDRVPIVPLNSQFASRRKGMPVLNAGDSGDPARWPEIIKAYHDTFDELGGYDAVLYAGIGLPGIRRSSPRSQTLSQGSEEMQKGFPPQHLEQEVITAEDYDKIINRGWNSFCEEYASQESGVSLEQINTSRKKLYMEDAKYWKERGVPLFIGGSLSSVEMTLSLYRTLPKFAMDMHSYPEKVKAAMEAMVPDLIQNAINDCKDSGVPCVMVGSQRGSGTYWNLNIFEQFFFPPFKKMVDALVDAGLTCLLHFDTDWTLNLPYFKELPKVKCICELDGTTNIFKAKEILKGHMCIMGDVPASLLSLGTPDKVTAYCKELIDIVGKDGGFILSTGCGCPIDAKFENVKAMVDTPKYYNPHV